MSTAKSKKTATKKTIHVNAASIEDTIEKAAGELHDVVNGLKKKYKTLDTPTQKKVMQAVAGAAGVLGLMLAYHKGKTAGVQKMKKKMGK